MIRRGPLALGGGRARRKTRAALDRERGNSPTPREHASAPSITRIMAMTTIKVSFSPAIPEAVRSVARWRVTRAARRVWRCAFSFQVGSRTPRERETEKESPGDSTKGADDKMSSCRRRESLCLYEGNGRGESAEDFPRDAFERRSRLRGARREEESGASVPLEGHDGVRLTRVRTASSLLTRREESRECNSLCSRILLLLLLRLLLLHFLSP